MVAVVVDVGIAVVKVLTAAASEIQGEARLLRTGSEASACFLGVEGGSNGEVRACRVGEYMGAEIGDGFARGRGDFSRRC